MRPSKLQVNQLSKFQIYSQFTGSVYCKLIFHLLAIYLQFTGSVNHPLPPVSAGLLVNGGVTYSSASSSNSNGSAADLTPRVRGLPSEHLQRRSAIKSILASSITLSALRSSTSRDNLTISSLLASSSCQCRFILRDKPSPFPFIVFRNSSKRAADADSRLAM